MVIYLLANMLIYMSDQHGSIETHKKVPMVSTLWFELIDFMRFYINSNLSLNLLKQEIQKQM